VQVVSDLKQLWPLVDFRRLLTVRLVSQCSDGLFQAGLATLFFFSPENATTATGVAAAFAVLLLPFTVVGPWAGVLLDRWRRRQVLLVGNLVRTALTVLIAVIMATAGVGPVVYVLALVTLSVNRRTCRRRLPRTRWPACRGPGRRRRAERGERAQRPVARPARAARVP
jgi:Na+/melibiose symporter-like transporter